MELTNVCLTEYQYHQERVTEALAYEPEPWQLDAWVYRRFHEELAGHDADYTLDDGTAVYDRNDLDEAWHEVERLARKESH